MNAEDFGSNSSDEIEQSKLQAQKDKLLQTVVELGDEGILNRVALILNHFPKTRNSDVELQLKFWEMYEKDRFNGNFIDVSVYPYLTRLTSIARSRAFIQNTLGLFQATPEIQGFRGTLKNEHTAAIKENKPDFPIIYAFSDESGKTEQNLVVGSVWFLDEMTLNNFSGKLLEWKIKCGIKGELKFKNISDRNSDQYKSLIDLMLANSANMSFIGAVNKRSGISNVQDALCKMYARVFTEGTRKQIESGRISLPKYLQIVKDAEEKGLDQLIISEAFDRLNNLSKSELREQLIVSKIMVEDSQQNVHLQLADLFAGSISRFLNANSLNSPKDDIAKYFLDVTGGIMQLSGMGGNNDSCIILQ